MKKIKSLVITVSIASLSVFNGCFQEEIEITENTSPTAVISPVIPTVQGTAALSPKPTSGSVKTPAQSAKPSVKPSESEKTPASPAQTGSTSSPVPSASSTPAVQNQAFRNVQVTKAGEDKYKVTGEARIFEATVSYVVEDGHNELHKGFTTADKGAPEWGSFSAEFSIKKERPNSTLTLILFEGSAKDSSRLHQLPVRLPG